MTTRFAVLFLIFAWLLPARIAVGDQQSQVEPIAWVNTKEQRRVFYTSLGVPEDFEIPQFRKLLLNGFFWARGRAVNANR